MPQQAESRRRTPRNTLSQPVIVAAAVALLDEHGIDTFSMRALAARLEVRPMAIYTHFRGKDELLDGVRGDLLRRALSTVEGDWADQLRGVARRARELVLDHPWLTTLMLARPLSGHETAETAEAILRVLIDAGFGRETAARAHVTLLTYVLGATSWEVQLTLADEGPERERRLRAAVQAMPESRYPTLVDLAPELGATVGGDQFEFGLDLLLSGLRNALVTG